MDSKTFITRLAKSLDTEPAGAQALTASLVEALKEVAARLDSAAIPGFGTFQTVKTDEHIAVDQASGARTLMPPSIRLNFTPSIVLRKKLEKKS